MPHKAIRRVARKTLGGIREGQRSFRRQARSVGRFLGGRREPTIPTPRTPEELSKIETELRPAQPTPTAPILPKAEKGFFASLPDIFIRGAQTAQRQRKRMETIRETGIDPFFEKRKAEAKVLANKYFQGKEAAANYLEKQGEIREGLVKKHGSIKGNALAFWNFDKEVAKGVGRAAFGAITGTGELIAKGAAYVSPEGSPAKAFFEKIDEDFDTLQDVVLNPEKHGIKNALSSSEEAPFARPARFVGEFLAPVIGLERAILQFGRVAYPTLSAVGADMLAGGALSTSQALYANLTPQEAATNYMFDIAFAPVAGFAVRKSVQGNLEVMQAFLDGAEVATNAGKKVQEAFYQNAKNINWALSESEIVKTLRDTRMKNPGFVRLDFPLEPKKPKKIKEVPEVKPKAKEAIEAPERLIEQLEEIRIRKTAKIGKPETIRDLRLETARLIKKTGAKIDDKTIRDIRAKSLLGEETVDEIISRKRGIITDAEAIERASRMKITVDDIKRLPKGAVLNKEQITAVRQVLQNEREVNKSLKDLVDKGVIEGGIGSTPAERALIKRAGEGLEDLPEIELLNRAFLDSTIKLRQLEIIELGARSEAGRALQALKQQVPAIDARMRAIHSRIKNLTPDKQQHLIEYISKMPIDDPKSFIKILEKLDQSDMFDKVAEWATAAKLWNPTTHAVNFGGNLLRQLVDTVVTGIADPMALKADLMGVMSGFKVGMRNTVRALTDEGYARQLSKYIEEGGRSPAIKGPLGKAVRIPFQALAAGDELFRGIGYQRAIYRIAHKKSAKKGLKGIELEKEMKKILAAPDLDMIEEANKEAKRLVFQEDLDVFSKRINQIRTPATYRTRTGKTIGLVARVLLPFLKTPVNLAKQAVDFSPFGLVKNIKLKEGLGVKNRKAAVEALMGSAIMTWGMMEAAEGNITGGVPRTAKERSQFYRENKLPYAIKFNGRWYQYARVDPYSTVLGFAADLQQLRENNEIDILSAAGLIGDQLKDKTFLRGISDVVKLFSGDEWEKKAIFKNMIAGSLFPSIIGHTARATDPVIRETKTLKNKIISQIPGLSKTLPAKIGTFGETIERANQNWNYFFNPIQSRDAKVDALTEELANLGHALPAAPKSFTQDKVKHKLSEKEYETFSKELGLGIRNEMIKLLQSNAYLKLSDDKKIKMIDRMRGKEYDKAKESFLGGSEKARAIKKLKERKSEFQAMSKEERGDKLRRLKEADFTKEEVTNALLG